MRYRRLHDTGLEVSAVCLGAADFGTRIDEPHAFDLLDRFAAAGGNFIDTANFYGRWMQDGINHSERIIGKWMASRANRDSIVVGTKGGHPAFSPGFETRPLVHRLSAGEIASDLEASLDALDTDRIDLYWLHYDDPSRPVAEMIETLEALVDAGKIRYYGCCNWSAPRLLEAQACCRSRSSRGFVANQLLWNLAAHNPSALWVEGMQSMRAEMREIHRDSAMACIPYSSQAGGFFSKALQPGFSSDPRYAGLRANYSNPETMRRVARVERFSAETGYEPTQIALACLINQPFVTVPIIGPHDDAQLSSSIAAIDIDLDACDLAFLSGR